MNNSRPNYLSRQHANPTAPPLGSVPQVDADQIRTALSIIIAPDSVLEIRALGVPTRGRPAVGSGYYDDLGEAARDIAEIEETGAAGVYVTLNPCIPGVLARSPNRYAMYPAHTTNDGEIMRRRWLFIDIDPIRPAGVAATDGECAAAEALAGRIAELLQGRGWPDPIMVASGNGVYLLYRVDERNDDVTAVSIMSLCG